MDKRTAFRTAFHRSSVGALNRFAMTPRTASAAFAMIAVHDFWPDTISDEARFLAFCGSMRHLAHGQLLQDLWVLFETDLRLGGYFVEFGAFDGRTHSNTLLLERRFGWRGVLAEPNLDLLVDLQETRSAIVDGRCVWDRSGLLVDLVLTSDPELSTVADNAVHDHHTDERRTTTVRSTSVPTVSLNDLLHEHQTPPEFDFLSVDTEGTEVRIMEAFDFSAHRPTLIAVEHNMRSLDERRLDSLMSEHGYQRRFRSMSRWDAWYRRAS
jgi:FkbM family methyltransferase